MRARHRSTAPPQLSAHAPMDPPLSHAICKYIERPPASIRIRTRKHCTAHQHMRQHHRIAHTFTSTNSRLSPSILAVSPPAGAALTHRASPRAPFASASPSDQHEAQRPACHRPLLPLSLVLPFHPRNGSVEETLSGPSGWRTSRLVPHKRKNCPNTVYNCKYCRQLQILSTIANTVQNPQITVHHIMPK